ncbi:hypothetical protein ACOZB2_22125 [Pantoea endophytica]
MEHPDEKWKGMRVLNLAVAVLMGMDMLDDRRIDNYRFASKLRTATSKVGYAFLFHRPATLAEPEFKLAFSEPTGSGLMNSRALKRIINSEMIAQHTLRQMAMLKLTCDGRA